MKCNYNRCPIRQYELTNEDYLRHLQEFHGYTLYEAKHIINEQEKRLKKEAKMNNYVEFISKRAVDAWGIDSQANQAIEELAELITAINHYRRTPEITSKDNLIEELADVEIMTNQVRVMWNITEDDITPVRMAKYDYLEYLLNTPGTKHAPGLELAPLVENRNLFYKHGMIAPGTWLMCPRCGYPNDTVRTSCQVCGADLTETGTTTVK